MAEKETKGMSREEVEKHLKGIGTTNAKISYLNDVLRRKGSFNQQTTENIYRILAELYVRKKDYKSAGLIYEDFLNEPEKAADVYSLSNEADWRERGNTMYQDMGKFEKAAKSYLKRDSPVKAIEALARRPGTDLSHAVEEAAKLSEELGNSGRAREIRSHRSHYEESISRKYSRRFYLIPAIGGVIGGLLFLSPKITGHALANLPIKTTSFFGAGLLILGLVMGFFWLRRR